LSSVKAGIIAVIPGWAMKAVAGLTNRTAIDLTGSPGFRRKDVARASSLHFRFE
jgi:hypothetical protein